MDSLISVYVPKRRKARRSLLGSVGEDLALSEVLRQIKDYPVPSQNYHFVFGAWASRREGITAHGHRECDLVVFDKTFNSVHYVEVKSGKNLWDGTAWRTIGARDPFSQVDSAKSLFSVVFRDYLRSRHGIDSWIDATSFVWFPLEERKDYEELLSADQLERTIFSGEKLVPRIYQYKKEQGGGAPGNFSVHDHYLKLLSCIDTDVKRDSRVLTSIGDIDEALLAVRQSSVLSGLINSCQAKRDAFTPRRVNMKNLWSREIDQRETISVPVALKTSDDLLRPIRPVLLGGVLLALVAAIFIGSSEEEVATPRSKSGEKIVSHLPVTLKRIAVQEDWEAIEKSVSSAQALGVGQTVRWNSEKTGHHGFATMVSVSNEDGSCFRFRIVVARDGKSSFEFVELCKKL